MKENTDETENNSDIEFEEILKDLKTKIKELSEKPVKRVLMLLSGGIDSPVAAYFLIRAGKCC